MQSNITRSFPIIQIEIPDPHQRLGASRTTLPEVAALAGHPTIKMTLCYAHLAPSHLRAGTQALEERTSHHSTGLALSTELRVTPVSRDLAWSA